MAPPPAPRVWGPHPLPHPPPHTRYRAVEELEVPEGGGHRNSSRDETTVPCTLPVVPRYLLCTSKRQMEERREEGAAAKRSGGEGGEACCLASPPPKSSLSTPCEDAEMLRKLEEEWQERLRTPVIELERFEQALDRAIDRMYETLPLR